MTDLQKHPKLTRFYRQDENLRKRLKAVRNFYADATLEERHTFSLTNYSLIYQCIFDLFYRQEEATSSAFLGRSTTSNSGALWGIPPGATLKEQAQFYEAVDDALTVFDTLVHDIQAYVRRRWQSRSIALTLNHLLVYTNQHEIRRRATTTLLKLIECVGAQIDPSLLSLFSSLVNLSPFWERSLPPPPSDDTLHAHLARLCCAFAHLPNFTIASQLALAGNFTFAQIPPNTVPSTTDVINNNVVILDDVLRRTLTEGNQKQARFMMWFNIIVSQLFPWLYPNLYDENYNLAMPPVSQVDRALGGGPRSFSNVDSLETLGVAPQPTTSPGKPKSFLQKMKSAIGLGPSKTSQAHIGGLSRSTTSVGGFSGTLSSQESDQLNSDKQGGESKSDTTVSVQLPNGVNLSMNPLAGRPSTSATPTKAQSVRRLITSISSRNLDVDDEILALASVIFDKSYFRKVAQRYHLWKAAVAYATALRERAQVPRSLRLTLPKARLLPFPLLDDSWRSTCPPELHCTVLTWLFKALQIPDVAAGIFGSRESMRMVLSILRQTFILPLTHYKAYMAVLDLYTDMVLGKILLTIPVDHMPELVNNIIDHASLALRAITTRPTDLFPAQPDYSLESPSLPTEKRPKAGETNVSERGRRREIARLNRRDARLLRRKSILTAYQRVSRFGTQDRLEPVLIEPSPLSLLCGPVPKLFDVADPRGYVAIVPRTVALPENVERPKDRFRAEIIEELASLDASFDPPPPPPPPSPPPPPPSASPPNSPADAADSDPLVSKPASPPPPTPEEADQLIKAAGLHMLSDGEEAENGDVSSEDTLVVNPARRRHAWWHTAVNESSTRTTLGGNVAWKEYCLSVAHPERAPRVTGQVGAVLALPIRYPPSWPQGDTAAIEAERTLRVNIKYMETEQQQERIQRMQLQKLQQISQPRARVPSAYSQRQLLPEESRPRLGSESLSRSITMHLPDSSPGMSRMTSSPSALAPSKSSENSMKAAASVYLSALIQSAASDDLVAARVARLVKRAHWRQVRAMIAAASKPRVRANTGRGSSGAANASIPLPSHEMGYLADDEYSVSVAKDHEADLDIWGFGPCVVEDGEDECYRFGDDELLQLLNAQTASASPEGSPVGVKRISAAEWSDSDEESDPTDIDVVEDEEDELPYIDALGHEQGEISGSMIDTGYIDDDFGDASLYPSSACASSWASDSGSAMPGLEGHASSLSPTARDQAAAPSPQASSRSANEATTNQGTSSMLSALTSSSVETASETSEASSDPFSPISYNRDLTELIYGVDACGSPSDATSPTALARTLQSSVNPLYRDPQLSGRYAIARKVLILVDALTISPLSQTPMGDVHVVRSVRSAETERSSETSSTGYSRSSPPESAESTSPGARDSTADMPPQPESRSPAAPYVAGHSMAVLPSALTRAEQEKVADLAQSASTVSVGATAPAPPELQFDTDASRAPSVRMPLALVAAANWQYLLVTLINVVHYFVLSHPKKLPKLRRATVQTNSSAIASLCAPGSLDELAAGPSQPSVPRSTSTKMPLAHPSFDQRNSSSNSVVQEQPVNAVLSVASTISKMAQPSREAAARLTPQIGQFSEVSGISPSAGHQSQTPLPSGLHPSQTFMGSSSLTSSSASGSNGSEESSGPTEVPLQVHHHHPRFVLPASLYTREVLDADNESTVTKRPRLGAKSTKSKNIFPVPQEDWGLHSKLLGPLVRTLLVSFIRMPAQPWARMPPNEADPASAAVRAFVAASSDNSAPFLELWDLLRLKMRFWTTIHTQADLYGPVVTPVTPSGRGHPVPLPAAVTVASQWRQLALQLSLKAMGVLSLAGDISSSQAALHTHISVNTNELQQQYLPPLPAPFNAVPATSPNVLVDSVITATTTLPACLATHHVLQPPLSLTESVPSVDALIDSAESDQTEILNVVAPRPASGTSAASQRASVSMGGPRLVSVVPMARWLPSRLFSRFSPYVEAKIGLMQEEILDLECDPILSQHQCGDDVAGHMSSSAASDAVESLRHQISRLMSWSLLPKMNVLRQSHRPQLSSSSTAHDTAESILFISSLCCLKTNDVSVQHLFPSASMAVSRKIMYTLYNGSTTVEQVPIDGLFHLYSSAQAQILSLVAPDAPALTIRPLTTDSYLKLDVKFSDEQPAGESACESQVSPSSQEPQERKATANKMQEIVIHTQAADTKFERIALAHPLSVAEHYYLDALTRTREALKRLQGHSLDELEFKQSCLAANAHPTLLSLKRLVLPRHAGTAPIPLALLVAPRLSTGLGNSTRTFDPQQTVGTAPCLQHVNSTWTSAGFAQMPLGVAFPPESSALVDPEFIACLTEFAEASPIIMGYLPIQRIVLSTVLKIVHLNFEAYYNEKKSMRELVVAAHKRQEQLKQQQEQQRLLGPLGPQTAQPHVQGQLGGAPYSQQSPSHQQQLQQPTFSSLHPQYLTNSVPAATTAIASSHLTAAAPELAPGFMIVHEKSIRKQRTRLHRASCATLLEGDEGVDQYPDVFNDNEEVGQKGERELYEGGGDSEISGLPSRNLAVLVPTSCVIPASGRIEIDHAVSKLALSISRLLLPSPSRVLALFGGTLLKATSLLVSTLGHLPRSHPKGYSERFNSQNLLNPSARKHPAVSGMYMSGMLANDESVYVSTNASVWPEIGDYANGWGDIHSASAGFPVIPKPILTPTANALRIRWGQLVCPSLSYPLKAGVQTIKKPLNFSPLASSSYEPSDQLQTLVVQSPFPDEYITHLVTSLAPSLPPYDYLVYRRWLVGCASGLTGDTTKMPDLNELEILQIVDTLHRYMRSKSTELNSTAMRPLPFISTSSSKPSAETGVSPTTSVFLDAFVTLVRMLFMRGRPEAHQKGSEIYEMFTETSNALFATLRSVIYPDYRLGSDRALSRLVELIDHESQGPSRAKDSSEARILMYHSMFEKSPPLAVFTRVDPLDSSYGQAPTKPQESVSATNVASDSTVSPPPPVPQKKAPLLPARKPAIKVEGAASGSASLPLPSFFSQPAQSGPKAQVDTITSAGTLDLAVVSDLIRPELLPFGLSPKFMISMVVCELVKVVQRNLAFQAIVSLFETISSATTTLLAIGPENLLPILNPLVDSIRILTSPALYTIAPCVRQLKGSASEEAPSWMPFALPALAPESTRYSALVVLANLAYLPYTRPHLRIPRATTEVTPSSNRAFDAAWLHPVPPTLLKAYVPYLFSTTSEQGTDDAVGGIPAFWTHPYLQADARLVGEYSLWAAITQAVTWNIDQIETVGAYRVVNLGIALRAFFWESASARVRIAALQVIHAIMNAEMTYWAFLADADRTAEHSDVSGLDKEIEEIEGSVFSHLSRLIISICASVIVLAASMRHVYGIQTSAREMLMQLLERYQTLATVPFHRYCAWMLPTVNSRFYIPSNEQFAVQPTYLMPSVAIFITGRLATLIFESSLAMLMNSPLPPELANEYIRRDESKRETGIGAGSGDRLPHISPLQFMRSTSTSSSRSYLDATFSLDTLAWEDEIQKQDRGETVINNAAQALFGAAVMHACTMTSPFANDDPDILVPNHLTALPGLPTLTGAWLSQKGYKDGTAVLKALRAVPSGMHEFFREASEEPLEFKEYRDAKISAYEASANTLQHRLLSTRMMRYSHLGASSNDPLKSVSPAPQQTTSAELLFTNRSRLKLIQATSKVLSDCLISDPAQAMFTDVRAMYMRLYPGVPGRLRMKLEVNPHAEVSCAKLDLDYLERPSKMGVHFPFWIAPAAALHFVATSLTGFLESTQLCLTGLLIPHQSLKSNETAPVNQIPAFAVPHVASLANVVAKTIESPYDTQAPLPPVTPHPVLQSTSDQHEGSPPALTISPAAWVIALRRCLDNYLHDGSHQFSRSTCKPHRAIRRLEDLSSLLTTIPQTSVSSTDLVVRFPVITEAPTPAGTDLSKLLERVQLTNCIKAMHASPLGWVAPLTKEVRNTLAQIRLGLLQLVHGYDIPSLRARPHLWAQLHDAGKSDQQDQVKVTKEYPKESTCPLAAVQPPAAQEASTIPQRPTSPAPGGQSPTAAGTSTLSKPEMSSSPGEEDIHMFSYASNVLVGFSAGAKAEREQSGDVRVITRDGFGSFAWDVQLIEDANSEEDSELAESSSSEWECSDNEMEDWFNEGLNHSVNSSTRKTSRVRNENSKAQSCGAGGDLTNQHRGPSSESQKSSNVLLIPYAAVESAAHHVNKPLRMGLVPSRVSLAHVLRAILLPTDPFLVQVTRKIYDSMPSATQVAPPGRSPTVGAATLLLAAFANSFTFTDLLTPIRYVSPAADRFTIMHHLLKSLSTSGQMEEEQVILDRVELQSNFLDSPPGLAAAKTRRYARVCKPLEDYALAKLASPLATRNIARARRLAHLLNSGARGPHWLRYVPSKELEDTPESIIGILSSADLPELIAGASVVEPGKTPEAINLVDAATKRFSLSMSKIYTRRETSSVMLRRSSVRRNRNRMEALAAVIQNPSVSPRFTKFAEALSGWTLMDVADEERFVVKCCMELMRDPSSARSCSPTNSALMPSPRKSPSRQIAMHPHSAVEMTRALVAHLYIGLRPHRLTTLRLVNSDTSTRRAIKLLDQHPTKSFHKIGVLYVAPNQDDQNLIFKNEFMPIDSPRNGMECPPLYRSFLKHLGWRVDISKFEGWVAKLEASVTGSESIYFSSQLYELMFHVATMMPSSSTEPQQLHKKQHLGNDNVRIVFSDSFHDYRPGTVMSQFNDAHIMIYPLDKQSRESYQEEQLYLVRVHLRPGIPAVLPITDGMIVPQRLLSSLVRATAVAADRARKRVSSGLIRAAGDTIATSLLNGSRLGQQNIDALVQIGPVGLVEELTSTMIRGAIQECANLSKMGSPAITSASSAALAALRASRANPVQLGGSQATSASSTSVDTADHPVVARSKYIREVTLHEQDHSESLLSALCPGSNDIWNPQQ